MWADRIAAQIVMQLKWPSSINIFLTSVTWTRCPAQQTPIHQLDPRAKLITSLVFITVVISFGKYEISALIPYFVYPVFLGAMGNVPPVYLLKKILLVSPFAVMIGIFNPLMDRDILVSLGGIGISGGWVSFASILIRFVLTVGAALILIAVTGFNAVCTALDKLGTPQGFRGSADVFVPIFVCPGG